MLVQKIAEDPLEAWTPKDLSAATAIKVEDVVTALTSLGLLRYVKGQHVINVTPKQIQQLLQGYAKTIAKDIPLDPNLIQWTPHPTLTHTKKRQRRNSASSSSTATTSS